MIAAVKFDRGNGNQMRDVGQKSERFANLRKTFAGSNKLSGNQRSQRQQTASSGKFKVFSDVCRECVNDEKMQRKDLHTFSKCLYKTQVTNREGQAGKRSGANVTWPKRKVNALEDANESLKANESFKANESEDANESEADGYLTEHDRQSIQSYRDSQRGARLPK